MQKFDKNLVNAAKTENKDFVIKNGSTVNSEVKTETAANQTVSTEAPKNENLNLVNAAGDQNSAPVQNIPPVQERDELDIKLDEFSKQFGGMLAGPAIIEMIDDFKTKALYVRAKSNGVDIPMEALKMDEKTKGLASLLVDHAVKGKIFEYLKKYPLIGAGVVVAISAGSSFAIIEMMKKNNDELAKLRAENEKLKSNSGSVENTGFAVQSVN